MNEDKIKKFIEEDSVFDWFPYMQDFSGKFVYDMINRFEISKKDKILDPYMGSGTTVLTSKLLGIDSVGIDYNPFCTFIGRVKCNWDMNPDKLKKKGNDLIGDLSSTTKLSSYNDGKNPNPNPDLKTNLNAPDMPNLDSWMADKVVKKVMKVKEMIIERMEKKEYRDFFLLVLASILRKVSNVTLSLNVTINSQKEDAPVFEEFADRAIKMMEDYDNMLSVANEPGKARIIQGDSRNIDLEENSFDFVVTSPPYPNDIDYVNQSRMEVFFLDLITDEDEFGGLKEGMITSDAIYYVWSKNRSKLLKNKCKTCGSPLTTGSNYYRCLDSGKFSKPVEGEYAIPEVMEVVEELEKAYEDTNWGWDYPKMTAEYFADMYFSLNSLRNVMRPGGKCVYVMGDAAFKGVHVPADKLIGVLAEKAGFENCKIEEIRERNATSHDVPLRESLVIFEK